VRGAGGEGEDERPIVPAVLQEHAQRTAEQRERLAGRDDEGRLVKLRDRHRGDRDALRRTAHRCAPLALIPDEAHLVRQIRGEGGGPWLPGSPVVGQDPMPPVEPEGAEREEPEILARLCRQEGSLELNLHRDATSSPGSALAA